MSLENFYNQQCVLCFSYYDWDDIQKSPQITLSNISSCLKHIPQDINQTVNWNQLGENNCLCFCTNCNDNVRILSKLNSDLEEIQRKIGELVNCIVLHVRKERGHFLSQSNPYCAQSNVNEKETNPKNEKLKIGSQRNEASSIGLNENDEIDNDVESINSDYSDGAKLDEEDITPMTGDNYTFVPMKESSKSKVQCKEQTKPKSSLQNLLESTSGFECSTCHKRFSRYTILKKHDCGKPTVECETRGLSFSSSGVLKLHTRSHTGEKPYKCETCGRAFSIKANLRSHIQSNHSKEKAFECKICGNKFTNAAALSKHKLSHRKEEMYKCDVCSKSFINLKLLKLHFVTHSTETSHPYKCDLCDKTFAFPSSITKHKKIIHLGERPCQCDICGKSFSTNYVLKKHKLIHSDEKPFQCSYCGRNFRHSKLLEDHEWIHKDLGTFTCDICGKSYKNSHSLKLHVRNHKEKIQCEICGKAIYRSNITTHIKIHRKETPPFQCNICGKIFSSKNGQISHVKRFCHICKIFFSRDKSPDALVRHQIEIHTVNTALYSNFISHSITNPCERKILPRRKCQQKAMQKLNYGESSSDEINSDNDDDSKKDLISKVEVKEEYEYSEREDLDF